MRNELQEARKMCADWEKGPVDCFVVQRRILSDCFPSPIFETPRDADRP